MSVLLKILKPSFQLVARSTVQCKCEFQIIRRKSTLSFQCKKLFSNNSASLVRQASCPLISDMSTSTSSQDRSIGTIYYGILTPHVRAVKLFSLSSSVAGIVVQPFLYEPVVSTGNVPVIIATYAFVSFFTFITPLLLHLLTKKYVIELGYNETSDTYIAKTLNFFCMTKKNEFRVDDVKVPDVPGMFTTLIAKGKPLFLDPHQFEDTDHYARIMGLDKPMDFKLYETVSGEKKHE